MTATRLRPVLAAAALTAAALLAASTACYEDDTSSPKLAGQLTRVLLTDSPFPYDSVQAVEVYVESIAASVSFDTTGTHESDWITVATPKKAVDLLTLQNGTAALLGEGSLAAGKYRALRMVINTARSRILRRGGVEAQVNWQASTGTPTLYAYVEGGEMQVPDQGADIVIDFDVGRSFREDYPGGPFTFLPWIRAVNRAATGNITGTVQAALLDHSTVPVPNATITVYRGNANADESTWSVAATARADSRGNYTVGYLMPGPYIVRAEAPGPRALAGSASRFLFAATEPGVSVAQGVNTPVSFALDEMSRSFLSIAGRVVIVPGDTTELTVVVSNDLGVPVTNPVVTWTSSNEAVAALVGSGAHVRVAGLAVGTSRVVARSGTLADSVTIVVGAAGADTTGTDTTGTDSTGSGGGGGPPGGGVAVAAVTISPTEFSVAVGDSMVFVATPRAADGQALTNRPVSWSVSDSTIAYFLSPPSGPPYAALRARARGTVTVTAVSEGKAGTATLRVP
jgi:hypothetical protein